MILNGCRFRLRIQMRCHTPYDFNGPHTVRNGHHSITVDALARSPFSPLAIHLPRRIDEHPIQVKKNCRAGKSRHSLFLYHSLGKTHVATAASAV